jgi:hypothetical protein
MTAVAPADILDPTADLAWIIEDSASDSLRESSREARFTVSNGFLGVRCSRTINQSGRLVLPPRTYVAGLFDTASPDGPVSALVPAADWLQLRATVDGALREHDGDVSPLRLVLDMRRGMVLTESHRHEEDALGFRARTLHLVSRRSRALGLQLVEIRIDSGESELTLEACIEEDATALVSERMEQNVAVWHTKQSGKRLGMAVAATLTIDGEVVAPAGKRRINLVVELEVARGACRDLRAHRCHYARRHFEFRCRRGGAKRARRCKRYRLARAYSRNTKRPGNNGGSAATSSSRETQRHSKRCDLPSII